MVKFSKQLEAQLIPEWKDAFVNYWQLKKHIKRIKISRSSKHAPHHQDRNIGFSILDPIRLAANKISDCLSTTATKTPQIIEVLNITYTYYFRSRSLTDVLSG